MSQLPAAGADIEQIAGLPEALTDKRRHARDIVGAVDPCRVELDRINRLRRRDVLRRARRNPRPRSICVTTKGNGHDDTRGNNSSPRTAAVGPSPLRGLVPPVRQHQDTPPAAPARDSCGGRSPGSRVLAADHLPKNTRSQWHLWSEARRLQLRGQPRRCAQAHAPRSLLIPCGNHRRPSCRVRTIASTSLADATEGL